MAKAAMMSRAATSRPELMGTASTQDARSDPLVRAAGLDCSRRPLRKDEAFS